MMKKYIMGLIYIFIFVLLYLASLYNYLLFHIIAEFFSIVVACGMFMFAWNSRKNMENNYFLFLGIAYLFVGGVDTIHTLAYKGMNIFIGFGSNLPTQCWILSRYLESCSLLIGLFFIKAKLNNKSLIFIWVSYFLVIGLSIISIFVWRNFPTCYLEDAQKLTLFKIISEYIISFILILTIVGIYIKRKEFDKTIIKLVVASIIITILSEMAFTLYTDVYGLFNLIGHYLKIVSFYLIYRAIISIGFIQPINLLFRNLKNSEMQYKAIVEDQTELIIRFNTNWETTFINDTYCKFFNIDKKSHLGKKFHPYYMSEKDKNDLKKHMQSLTIDHPFFTIDNPVEVNNVTKWLSWNCKVIFDEDRPFEYQFVGRDITEQKNIEAVKNTLIDLQYSNMELEHFASSVSHDLKSPLNVVLSYINMISRKYINPNDETGIEITQEVKKRTNIMLKMIDNLLLFSKTTMKTNATICDLNIILKEAIKNLLFEIEKTQAVINYSEMPIINVDEIQFISLFQNLIGNAIKYCKNKKPEIYINAEKQNKEWLFSIKDNGIGIDESQKNDIFVMFNRGYEDDSEYSGIGIGLALCKKIITNHNGKIWVESEGKDKGSTFYFSVPD